MRLLLGLANWQAVRVAGAMGISAGAVTFFVLAVSLVLLPADVERLRQPLYLSITQSHVTPLSPQAISLVWHMPRDDRAGWQHRLMRHDITAASPEPQLLWPQLRPSAIGRGPTPDVLYAGCWDGSLWRLNALRPETEPVRVGEHSEQGPSLVECSPDGRWLVTHGPHDLQVLELATGRVVWKSREGRPQSFAIHPDSQRLVVGQMDGTLVEMAMETGDVLRPVAALDGAALNAVFSADGRRVALVTGSGNCHVLDWDSGRSAWPADWRDTAHHTRSALVVFSPSGERVLFSSGDTATLCIWNLRTMRLEGELRGHTKSINGAVFVDEQRLCTFGADGSYRVWDVSSRRTHRVQSIDVTSQAG